MQPERAALLRDLLREMREQDRGFFPDEAWLEIHRNFAMPYVEVVLFRFHPSGAPEFFLMRRDEGDVYWPGRPWHIPGGLWRVGETRDVACAGVARRELQIAVTVCREVMTFKWPDHPYANAISHVCLCVSPETPATTDAARFFPATALPEPMLRYHASFLAACANQLVGPS
jgi:ADP-ribose pyrophosphatase YjhB (NUDIX family)